MCGRCRVMLAAPGQAWCVDCADNDDPADYVAGVHITQVELPDPWQPADSPCT